MPQTPYRIPADRASDPPRPGAPASLEIAIVTLVVWAVGVLRVVSALRRPEAPSYDLDAAWLFVLLAPIVIWQEFAAWRRRRL